MRHILELFPNWQSEIEQLYQESSDFHELCQDYEEVLALIATRTDLEGTDRGTVAEFQALLQDLETEIMDYLNANVETAGLSDQASVFRPTRPEEQQSDEVT